MSKATHTAFPMKGEKVEYDDMDQVVSAERSYRVIESFGATAVTAVAAAGLPANGAPHPDYPSLKLSSRSPQMQEDGITWVITCKYLPGGSPTAQNYKLIRIEYGTHSIQEDILRNIGTNLPLLDANMKPFESTVQEAVEYPFIKIVKKRSGVNRSDVLDKSGSINNAQVTVAGVVIPTHCGKIKIVATENPENQFPWEITYEVSVRNHLVSNIVPFSGQFTMVNNVPTPKNPLTDLITGTIDIGWDIGILNRGYYYYVPGGHNVRAMESILDNSGNVKETRPTATPVPLGLDGTLLPDGQTPIALRVQTIKERSWASLGLNLM